MWRSTWKVVDEVSSRGVAGGMICQIHDTISEHSELFVVMYHQDFPPDFQYVPKIVIK